MVGAVKRLVLVLFVAGCLQTGTTLCEDGRTCPAGTECDDLHASCVEKSQLTRCKGLDDGLDCGIRGADDGVCDQGVCITKRCGDGYQRGNEACDGEDVPMTADCTKLGFYEPGRPACNDACSFDVDPATTVCKGYCGDGELAPGIEVCEIDQPLVSSCVAFGFGAGTLGCVDCRADTNPCVSFGWQLEDVTGNPFDIRGTAIDDVWALSSVGGNANALAHWDGMAWTDVDLSGCQLAVDTSGEEFLRLLWTPAKGIVFAAGGKTLIRVMGGTCTKFKLPNPDFDDIQALWASSATDVWVGSFDQVWHWDGVMFTSILSTLQGTTHEGVTAAIWGSSPDDVWVTIDELYPTYDQHLTHYTGGTWSAPIDPGFANPGELWGTSATDVYVGDRETGDIARYDGNNWMLLPRPPLVGNGGYRAIYRGVTTSDGRIYVAGNGLTRSYVLVYDGTGWADLAAPAGGLPALWATAGGNVFSNAPAAQKVARFTGSGRLDTPQSTVFGTNLIAYASDDAYAIRNGVVVHWDGGTWKSVFGDVVNLLVGGIALSPAGTAFAGVGSATPLDKKGFYRRASNGTWTQEVVDEFCYAVWANADDDVWILGSLEIMHWTSGSTVDKHSFNTGASSPMGNDIWAASLTDVYVAADRQVASVNHGVMLHFDGANFTEQTLPAGVEQLDSVWGTSATNIYAISRDGLLLHSTGDGTWTAVTLPAGALANDVWGAAEDLFVASSVGLLHFDGKRWDPVSLGSEVNAVRVTGAGNAVHVIDGFAAFHEIIRLAPWPVSP
jgi:hypothetical protein